MRVFDAADREQILAIFVQYDFKDALGHSLLNCLDFQELVDRAVGPEFHPPHSAACSSAEFWGSAGSDSLSAEDY